LLKEYSYKASIYAEDYIQYKISYGLPIIVHLKDNILELRSIIKVKDVLGDYKLKDEFSIFLQCKFEPYKITNKKKKKKTSKIMSYSEFYLIFLGIISLINFGGIVYLIKRKK
jgi:hypothetical protein